MLDFLFAFIENIRPINDEVKEYISQNLELVEVPRNHCFLRDGDRCDHVYIVVKGILRMYYIKDGEEVCSRFAEEGQLCLSVNSFFSRVPGYEFIESVEPAIVAKFHHDKLHELYSRFEEYNYIGRVVVQQYFIRSEERLYLLRKQNAEERYLYFCEHYPQIIQRVQLKYIATYLNMTMETLSRIRRKISQ
jgi:CRP-like cAMP-binding protein